MSELADIFIPDDASALQEVLEEVALATVVKSPTAAARQDVVAEAISATDIDKLIDFDEVFRSAVDTIIGNPINLEQLGSLDDSRLASLMREMLNQKTMEDVLKVRYKMVRAAVFAHLTEAAKAKGAPDPVHAPGEAVVPALGKKFVRQGGRLKAALDENHLAELLGPERAAQIFKTEIIPEEVIPAHEETVFDQRALVFLINQDNSVMELVRQCVIPGGYTPQSFHVKDIG